MRRLDNPGFIAVTALLAGLAVAYATARALSSDRGLHGTYMISAGEVVHTRVDRQLAFEKDVLLRSAFTSHWRIERHGFPHRFPAYSVSWTGFITIPEPPARSDVVEPGLWRRIYAGPSFGGEPIDLKLVPNVSFAVHGRDIKPINGPYSIEWYGQMRVPEGGVYTFWTDSDDGSWLYIEGRQIVDNGGAHPLQKRSGTVELTAGLHPFRVRFNDLGGSGLIDVFWAPPGVVDRQPIPEELLSHSPPGTAKYSLAVDSSVPFRLSLDGAELLNGGGESDQSRFSAGIEPGRHAIEVELSAPESSRGVRFELGWLGAAGRVTPVPEEALSLGERPSRWRLWLDVGFALLVASLAVALFLVPSWRARARAYGGWLWEHRGGILLTAILLLGLALRLHQYDVVPLFGETFDEFKTGWIGWTLLVEGEPSGWTLYSVGPDTHWVTWLDHTVLIGKPKLHPPPLFPVLTGIASVLAGTDQMFDVRLPVIRLPAIACALGVTLLVYLLALRLFDRRVALVAALLHATIPTIVLSGRLAKEENLLALLAVASMLFLSRYLDSGRSSWLWLSVLAAGLSPLTKEIGFYVVAVVLLLLAREKKWREMARALPLFVGLYAVYLGYCWRFSGEALRVLSAHGAATWEGFGAVARMFGVGRIVERSFGNGWMIWLSMSLMVAPIRKQWVLVGPVLSYVLVLGLTLSQTPDYGWYRIPLYPFLCIAGAVFVVQMVRRVDLFRVVIFTVLAVLTSLDYAVTAATLSPWTFRWALFLALVPFALHFVFRTPWARLLARSGAVLLIAFFVLANVGIVWRFLSVYLGG